MWSDKYDPDEEGTPPLGVNPYAERPPGPPPWAIGPPRMHPATRAFIAVVGVAAASLIVSVCVGLWRFLDQIANPR